MTKAELENELKSARKRIEELERNKGVGDSLFRRVFEQIKTPIVLFDKNGEIIRLNRAGEDLFPGEKGNIVGNFNMFDDKEALAKGYAAMFERALDGEPITMAPSLCDPSKENNSDKNADKAYWTETSYYPIRNERGEIECVAEVNIDVTQRISAEKKLNELAETLEEKIAERTYELRETLASRLETEKYIVESEKKFRKYLESSPIACFILDVNGFITLANEKSEQLTGRRRDELLNRDFSIVNENGMELFERLKSENRLEEEIEISHKFGDNSQSILSAAKINDNSYIAYCVDITERKRAEEKIAGQEKYIGDLIETANIMVVSLNVRGEILVFNKTAEEITGYSKKEVLGENWFDIFVPKEKYPEVFHYFEEFSEEKRNEEVLENPIFCKDGSEKIISWKNSMLRDQHGSRVMTSFGIDVTEQIAARENLVESEEKYRTLFNTMKSGYALQEAIYGEDGEMVDFVYLDVNPAYEKNTGLKKNDVIGKSIKEILPDVEEYWIKEYGEVVKTGIPKNIERYSKSLDRYFNVSIFRPNQDRFAIVFDDVTDRKKYEIELKNSEQSLKDLIYVASHDLQSPLVSLVGFSNMILKKFGAGLEPDAYYAVERLKVNAERMHKLVLSLLDLSRLNTVKMKFVRFDAEKIVREICEDFDLTVKENGANIRVGNLPPIFGDEMRLRTVFWNLIANALQYGGKNVTVGYIDGKYFVRDDGLGVSKNNIDKIFKPGERLKKNEAEGVGMGLTFCKRVISQHKGEIWAESDGEGRGSTFYFTINE